MRVLVLNLNHRTLPAPIRLALIHAIAELFPDILVFNEFVDVGVAQKLRKLLTTAGYPHQAVSRNHEYRPGRWHNQVLIASRERIDDVVIPEDGPDSMCATNTLFVTTFGLRVTGIRVPAYTAAVDWYGYWAWANDGLEGDVAIGDFNADPSRPRKWDRVLATLEAEGKWFRPEVDGEWSYKGNNGSTSRVDHVLVRNGVKVTSAQYVTKPFVPTHTDHAALVVDFER